MEYDSQNDSPIDKVAEQQGFEMYSEPNVDMPEPSPLEVEYLNDNDPPNETVSIDHKEKSLDDSIVVQTPEGEIRLPKDAKVKLSTRAGDEMELSVKDWADAPWSKKEISKIVNEKVSAERQLQQLREAVSPYADLDMLINSNPQDLSGPEWAAQVIGSIYKLRPERGDDLKAFFNDLREGTLDPTRIDNSFTKIENLKLKNKLNGSQQKENMSQLSEYAEHLSNNMIDTLKVTPEVIEKKIESLLGDGTIQIASNKEGFDRNVSILYQSLLTDKAVEVYLKTGLNPEDFTKYGQDLGWLVSSNPGGSIDDLADKFTRLVGTPNVSQAKSKAESFRSNRNRGPENITPKPLDRQPKNLDINHLSPFEYMEKKYGISFK